jgi:phosphonate transport system substrate-binding protein
VKNPRLIHCMAGLLAALSIFAARGQTIELAVSEGTSGGTDAAEIMAKYEPVAQVIGKAIGARVSVVLAREFASLEQGMKEGRYEFVMARPSDYPARGLRDYGYSLLATAAPQGRCLIIVRQDSPMKTLADARGKNFLLPEKTAYMSKFCTAALRDQGIDTAKERVQYMREQGAIAWSVDGQLGDVGGIASYSGASKDWAKKGHRVLHESRPQPYFPLIASKSVTAAQVEKVRAALKEWSETEDGKVSIKRLGFAGMEFSADPAPLLKLLTWLEKAA